MNSDYTTIKYVVEINVLTYIFYIFTLWNLAIKRKKRPFFGIYNLVILHLLLNCVCQLLSIWQTENNREKRKFREIVWHFFKKRFSFWFTKMGNKQGSLANHLETASKTGALAFPDKVSTWIYFVFLQFWQKKVWN